MAIINDASVHFIHPTVTYNFINQLLEYSTTVPQNYTSFLIKIQSIFPFVLSDTHQDPFYYCLLPQTIHFCTIYILFILPKLPFNISPIIPFQLEMNTQHRLMKIVQIQNNYQKHRERLMSIQHINARKKKLTNTIRPSETSTAYKQNKLKADIFTYKEKHEQIQHQNMILLSKIEKQYGKVSQKKIRKDLSRSQSSHSVRSVHSARNIHSENVRIYQKINNTKSIYSKIRKEGTQSNGVKLNTSKEEILHLLVNQLGVKPSVLLPTLRKNRPSRSTHHRTLDLREAKAIRFELNNLDEVRKKHSLTSTVLPKK